MRDNAIGIFDSGVGGLTVLRRIVERLPDEDTVYLGDTARVPYGTKSPATVVRYAFSCARILLEHDIKLLVVACNTASSCALEALRDELDIPVLGVVEPGARAAVRASRRRRIGVAGTPGTIASGAYQNAIKALDPSAEVFVKACPLLVPLAEEGWTSGAVPEQVVREYLVGLLDEGIDALVLGCTHYPLLKETIAKVAGGAVSLVDSAEAAAEVVVEVLDGLELRAESNGAPRRRFLVSDSPEQFARVGQRFLGRPLEAVEWVDF